MKKAILYIRVSTDEQAETGFSLRHQEEQLKIYCVNKEIEAVKIFTEDYSAKTFNRPEYKKLFDFAERNKNDIDYLLFVKWDRFSRNIAESYVEIGKLQRLNIKPLAIEQPINTDVPEELLMLTIYLASPEVENKRRSLNVKVGMRRSRKEGRYLGATPRGYTSVKDEHGKPLLVPNKDAKHIKRAFELIGSGNHSQREVINILKEDGCTITRTRMSSILKNPLYKGFLKVPAYKDEPEQIIKGIHEPIISEILFEQVQQTISGRRPKKVAYKTRSLDKFPLRGIIECEKCGNKLTASSSKGNGGFYEYYHCTNGCSKRFSVKVLDKELENILKGLKLKPEIKELYIKMLEKELAGDKRKSVEEKKRLTTIISNLNQKLEKIQNLLIEGTLDSDDYKEMKSRLKLEKLEAEDALEKVNDLKRQNFVKQLDQAFGLIEKLSDYYINGNTEAKRKIIGSMFPQKFIFENNQVRTKEIDKTFLLLCKNSKGLKRIKKRDISDNSKMSRNVQETRQISNFIMQDVDIILHHAKLVGVAI